MARPAASGPADPVFTETSAASVDPLAYEVGPEPDPAVRASGPGASDGEDASTVMELVDDDPEHRWAGSPSSP
ncbi:hypothetical protein BH708_10530 [Brachybacterium sp. P6-10-X1]|uniref:hypothetical protein n=1 Tax=Brachybacterium sp. P6-10-X1 TaxID=1903186 RepID=UPI0009718FDD|nr:hypothetical protein [Brachybacterium sp. P6-10-X1]APX33074.1 hypothetical protein BH708_10530 [Brachybacterium sp. P6-10-X1]